MKYFLVFLLTPLFYIVFYAILVVFHPIQVVTLRFFGYQAHKKTVDIMNFLLMGAPFVTGASYQFSNFQAIETDRPVLFISNHQSMWDIPPMIWKLRANHPKFVAKKSLTVGIPSISFNLKNGGSVNIDRKKPEEAVQKINAFAKYLRENNRSVIIYPEGKRTRNGKVGQFKVKGVEAILKEIPDALIVPIAISGTFRFDRPKSYFKNVGVKMKFEMLPKRTIKLEHLETELKAIETEIAEIVHRDLQ